MNYARQQTIWRIATVLTTLGALGCVLVALLKIAEDATNDEAVLPWAVAGVVLIVLSGLVSDKVGRR